MRVFASWLLNIAFFTVVIVLAVSVATIALTKKVNEYRSQNSRDIKATVVKEVVPVLAYSRGVIKKLHVKEGEEVKRNAPLIEMDNPVLAGKIEALEQYQDNVSAQTEARVAKEELKNLNITAPFDGVIGTVSVTKGSPVENLSKIMTLYSNENVRLSAELTTEQYQIIQRTKEVKAYNERLNQSITIIPDILKPEEKTTQQPGTEKKIGVYFKLKNQTDSSSLLQNEDLILLLKSDEEKIQKPIDYFVNFWNGLIAQNDKQVIRPL